MNSHQHNKINSFFGLRHLYSTSGAHFCPFITVNDDNKVYSILNQRFAVTHDYFQRGFDFIALKVVEQLL